MYKNISGFQPFFSVIVPTYNRRNLIAVAMRSVLMQTFQSWELIIVDDGSTDDTEQVVSNFVDSRIKYIKKNHAERSAARNYGIENSVGRYVCFLDSDDYYLDFHLQTFRDRIQREQYAEALYFCNTSENCDGIVTELPFNPRPARNNVEFVLLNLIGVPRICISRQILANYKFNIELTIGEDREFLARVVAKYPIIHIPVSTQVIVDHANRSVAINNYRSYVQNLETARYLLANFKQHLSAQAKRYIMAKGYNGMMSHHYSVRRPLAAFYWFVRLCLCDLRFVHREVWSSFWRSIDSRDAAVIKGRDNK